MEARAIASLNHPGIVTVYDVGNFEGVNYIATEFVEGRTLRDLIGGKFKLRNIVLNSIQICDALAAALDPACERQVVESYLAVMRGRTSIVISHRAAVAEAADQVAVVEGSRLVETGPPRVLAASGGAFARLFGAGTGVNA